MMIPFDERVSHFASLAKYAVVGSTGQRNMIYFMKYTEAHSGKDRTTRFIAATVRRALATLENGAVVK